MNKYPIVLIEWQDSAFLPAKWHWEDQIEEQGISRCVSVGFLIRNTKKEKLIATSVGGLTDADRQLSGIIAIPTCCVIKMKKITSELALLVSYGQRVVSNRNRKPS